MKNYSAWDITPLESKEGSSNEEILRHLVGWAILAPSSHNVQPWRFRIYPKGMDIDLLLHPSGILPVSDGRGRQAHISMGCALENLRIAIMHYGFQYSQINFLGGKYPDSLVAVNVRGSGLGISPNSATNPFFTAMKARVTNRGLFDSDKPVPPDFIEQCYLFAIAEGIESSQIKDFPTRFALAEIQYQADRYVIAKDDFRHELGDYFLPNDSLASVGMPGSNFGLKDEMSLRVHRELKKPGPFDHDLAVGMAGATREALRGAPYIGVLSVRDDTPASWVTAGQVFERIAIYAQVRGLAISVYAAMVEVERLNKLLKLRLNTLCRPTIIFRVGYSKEQRPHPPRLNISEVLES